MNISSHHEKNFIYTGMFIWGIIAALSLYGCGESDKGSSQQSQEKATEMATSTMPEATQPETPMVTEEPASPAPEMPEAPMVAEEPVSSEAEMTNMTPVVEEPVIAEPEMMDMPATVEVPEIQAPDISTTPPVTVETATETVEEQVAAVTEAAQQQAPSLTGRELYNTYCAVCHKTGLNAAPKYGQKAYWAKRIAQGRDVVYKHSIEGLRGMPPRGGIPGLSDEDVKAAVDYMVKAVGGWGDS